MSEKKCYKLWVQERYSEEVEFTGTEEELEQFLMDYEVNKSSAVFDFEVDKIEEKEV